MGRPNVILITSHDTGQHFHCYGDRTVHTPGIDNLAAGGVLFKNNFCTGPLCSPSRGSIITGKYPCSNGLMGLVNRGWDMPDSEKSLPHYLKEAGYDTLLFGFQHERRDPAKSGYDRTIKPEQGIFSRDVIDLLVDFIRKRKQSGSFLASVGFYETHLPFDNPRFTPDNPDEVCLPAYIPDTPETRLEMAQFHGLVREMDYNIGRLLETLKECGMEENTIFIQTTDHGIAFPRAKSTLYDPGIKTAFIVRWPAGIPGGRICEELVSNVDILPTLLELAGRPVPEDVQGRSIAPLLQGREQAGREFVFAEKDWHNHYDPKRCIRTKEYKYIRNFEKGQAVLLPTDIARSAAGKVMPADYLKERQPEELYNLKDDPDELRNIAADPRYAGIKEELCLKLYGCMENAGDYLSGFRGVEAYWK